MKRNLGGKAPAGKKQFLKMAAACLIFCGVLGFGTTGSVSEAAEAAEIFSFSDIDGMEFGFSSGIGDWYTSITVNADGSFTGVFYDFDMGDSDDLYPNGTVKHSDFCGQFSDPAAADGSSALFSIESLTLTTENGTSEIIEDTRYEYCEPYGLEAGDELILYSPGTPVSDLPEEYVQWIYGLSNESALSRYGLYDLTFGSGWIGSFLD